MDSEFQSKTPAPTNNDNEQLFACLTHVSPLAGFILPALGTILAPILWWALMKDRSEAVRQHGPEVMNFAISFAIYIAISFLFVFVLIGIPILFLLVITMIVFSIIGAVKAANGERFRYPLILRFFKDADASNG
jgi:uncharacterized protein